MGRFGVRHYILFALLALIATAGIFVVQKTIITQAAPGINKTINFQGKMTDDQGLNVADGTYQFEFRMYTVASGGSATWTETVNLTVTDGIFHHNLGSTTPLPGSVDFDTDNIFLGITFNSDADGEMTPRIQLTATPYAFNSDQLDGLDASDFLQLSPSAAQSGDIAITGSVSAASLVLSDGSSNTATIEVGSLAGDYTYVIPTTTGDDIFCLEGLGNCGGGVGISAIGTLDSQTASANGAVISSSTLYLQSASASNPGVVNTGTQTFAGDKTFGGAVKVGGAANVAQFTVKLNSAQTAPAMVIESSTGFEMARLIVQSGSIGLGSSALSTSSTGSANVAIGLYSMMSNGTGGFNVALGTQSLFANDDGSNNIAVGFGALMQNQSGNNNVALGQYSLATNSTGEYNIGIGASAGSTIATGSYNIAIGYNAAVDDPDASYQLNIADLLRSDNYQTGNLTVGTSDTTGQLLVLDTKTGSGDPTGANGGMYYNSNDGKFRCYEDGAWKDCISSGSGSGDVLNNGQNGTVRIGSNDANSTILEANNTDRLTLSSSGTAVLDANTTINGLSSGTGAALTVNTNNNNNSGLLIQGGTFQALNLLEITNSSLGYAMFRVEMDGEVYIRPNVDGHNVLNVSNAAGTDSVFRVSTSDGASYALYLNSTYGITSGGAMSFTGSNQTNYTTPLGSTVSTKINIQNFDPGNYNQIIAMGLPSTAATNSRALTLLDARSGSHQPTLAIISPNENQIMGLSWDGSNTDAFLKTSTSTIGIKTSTGTSLLVQDTGTTVVNGFLQVGTPDANAQLFVLDVKNTSGDPTGGDGSMYYNSDSGKFRCYENGGWTDCISAGTGDIINGGQNGAVTIGTNNSNALVLETNNTARISISSAGHVTQTGGSLQLTGTTTANYRMYMTGTVQSASSSLFGIQNNMVFEGSSASGVYGLYNTPTIHASSGSIPDVFGFGGRVDFQSGYAGTVTNAYGVVSLRPSAMNGVNVQNYIGLGAQLSNSGANGNSDNTSGTLNNFGLRVFGGTAAAGTGGTLNNYGARITLSTGATSGTTNYGVYIDGNGGGSNNWALYSTSTAASLMSGALTVGGQLSVGASNSTGTLLVLDTKTGSGDSGVATVNGGMYYNSADGKFRCYENGTWKDCIGSGGGGGSLFTDAGAHTYLTSTSDQLVVGSTSSMSAKLAVVGTADQTQFFIRANGTQTNPLVLFQGSGGSEIGRLHTDGTNYFFGTRSGSSLTTGYANNGFGFQALQNLTTGYGNSAIGDTALFSNTTGRWNTAIGSGALYANISSYDNTAIGANALAVSTGNENTAIGTWSLNTLASGWGNIAIGRGAGSNLTSGSENILIGFNVNAPNTSGSNQLNIGNILTSTNFLTGNLVVGTSDTTGQLLVLDIKTDSGDPTGVNGGMYYNSDMGKFRCYEANTWKDCIGSTSTTPPALALLEDDFDDNALDAAKWTEGSGGSGTSIDEQNQQLEVSISSGGNAYAWLDGNNIYDMTDAYASVEVKDAGLQSDPESEAYMGVTDSTSIDNDAVSWSINNGVLRAQKSVGGVFDDNIDSVTYNSVDHAYLRIRAAGGTTYWETSPDGVVWTTQYSESNPIDLTAACPFIGAGAWDSLNSSSTVIFDNFLLAENGTGGGGSGLNILDGGNSMGAALTIGTNDNYGLNLKVNNTTVAAFSATGQALFQNASDSTTGFVVQNAGGDALLSVDTTNSYIILGDSDQAGQLRINDGYGNVGSVQLESFGVGQGWMIFKAGGTNIGSGSIIAEFNDTFNWAFRVGATGVASSFNYGLNVADGLTVTSGNVGIGTAGVSGRALQVSGIISAKGTSARLQLEPSGGGTTNLWNIDNNAGTMRFFRADYASTGTGSNGVVRLQLNDSGTGTTTIAGTNSCTIGSGTGTTSCTSDARKKHDIQGTTDNLNKILQLNPVSYYWNSDTDNTTKRIGLIAQDVKALFPEAVEVDSDGYYTLDYSVLVSPLIGAIKELSVKVNANTAQISVVQSEVATLTASLSGYATAASIQSLFTDLSGRVNTLELGNVANLSVSGAATIGGDLSVAGVIYATNINLAGKIVTAGVTPSAVLGEHTGTGAVISVTGNDTAGDISLTAGTAQLASGEQFTITFNAPFNAKPRVNLTPTSEDAAKVRYYVEPSTTGFKIVFIDTPLPGKIYGFNYFVVQ